MLGVAPEVGLPASYHQSQFVWAVVNPRNKPVAVFGLGDEGDVWMVGTPYIEKHKMAFLRGMRQVADQLEAIAGTSLNCLADSRNKLHNRWLKWMGFKEISRQHFGPQFVQFIEYRRTA